MAVTENDCALLFSFKMKLFLSARKFYHTVGIDQPSQTNQNRSFNLRIVSSLFISCLYCLVTVLFLILESPSNYEYVNNVCIFVSLLLFIPIFLTSFWNREKLFLFIEKLEEFNEQREWRIASLHSIDVYVVSQCSGCATTHERRTL